MKRKVTGDKLTIQNLNFCPKNNQEQQKDPP